MSEHSRADELFEFWFADAATSVAAARQRNALWFGQSDEFDRAIAQRFGDLPARAMNGELDSWLSEPRAALALVIALDQFPRNLYRGTAQAFAFDPAARERATTAVAAGFPELLHSLEATFFFLPFEHAEELSLQDQCVAGYSRQLARAAPEFKPLIGEFVAAGEEHRQLISTFGRFPHRNRILGRASTASEVTHLAAGGKTFGQGAAQLPAP